MTGNAFLRGFLVAEFLQSRRRGFKAADLQAFLSERGHDVTVRTCQRYLVYAETLVEVKR